MAADVLQYSKQWSGRAQERQHQIEQDVLSHGWQSLIINENLDGRDTNHGYLSDY
jgi:hypothetical protein